MQNISNSVKRPRVVSIFSTKGGVGKTTKAVNISAACADVNLKGLLIDGDISQPTSSSYYKLSYEAPYGIYELLSKSIEVTSENFISQTCIPNLDLVKSNDPHGKLITTLMHAPDGRLRLRNILSHPIFSNYDFIIIDSQGARTIMSEVILLASDITMAIVKPSLPDIREFLRGTIPIFEELIPFNELGIKLPPIKLLINCMDYTKLTKEFVSELQSIIDSHSYSSCDIQLDILETKVHNLTIYNAGHRLGQPVHRLEYESKRKSASAAQTMSDIACELFPEWKDKLVAIANLQGGRPYEKK